MTKKSKTVKEDDLKTKLIEEGELSHEAIENLITIRNGIDRHYAFAESAIPTDIFKPNLIKIENTADAEEYFENSVDEYHKPENHSYLEELYSWFENDYKLYSPFLSDKECNQGDYYHVIECIYASKLLKLPYEHICNSFNLREEEEIGFKGLDCVKANLVEQVKLDYYVERAIDLIFNT